MAKFQDQYDAAFLGILQNEGQITGFLDAVFSFLFRRTDFYVELTSKEDKMGFFPGVAEKLVLKAFKKYERMAKQQRELHRKRQEGASKAKPKDKMISSEPQTAESTVPEPARLTATSPGTSTTTLAVTPVPTSGETAEMSNTKASITDTKDNEPMPSNQVLPDEKKEFTNQNTTASASDNKKTSTKTLKEDESDDDSEIARQQKMFQANPDSYNGAMRDGYSWSQSITDLDIKIYVPDYIHKGKDVQVEIQRKHITAKCRTQTGDWQTLIDDDLPWEINREQSIWSLEPQQAILVNLEKVQERWWECVLVSEPKINVRKIDASRPITDLDDEAQAKIEEMMYNEHQKRLGLPQSHEKKVHSILKKAWDAEGSPFKGQPFDPTKLNISPDGVMNIS